MAGIINKIGDALHIGGNKDGDDKKQHDGAGHQKHEGDCATDHKKHESESKSDDKAEHKEGIIDKIKDKIHGEDSGSKDECGEGEKKKKKKKKEKKEGHHEDGSSSSDSD